MHAAVSCCGFSHALSPAIQGRKREALSTARCTDYQQLILKSGQGRLSALGPCGFCKSTWTKGGSSQLAVEKTRMQVHSVHAASVETNEPLVRKEVEASADRLGVLDVDPDLSPHADHLRYRFNQYQTKKELIEKYEGSLEEFSEGYKKFGFNRQDGVTVYREWVPSAKEAMLVGDFNGWNGADYRMEKNEFGVWSISLPDRDGKPAIPHGSKVKIRLMKNDGNWVDCIPAWIKWAIVDHSKFAAAYDGVYWDPPASERYEFKNPRPPQPTAPRIYEAHVGMSSAEPRVASYREFADNVLPRIKANHYNTIQLMAVMEHAYYGCFGYHVTNFFAVSSRSGTPDDLKYLIDKAHGMGIRVLMDCVHSHASTNTLDGLNGFDLDPGKGGSYFHDGARGYHSLWDSRLFNYGAWEVQRFLLSNLRWWLEEYQFDGFRFDGVTSMLYHHHGLNMGFSGNYHEYFSPATDVEAGVYLMLANELIHKLLPSATMIAEDVSGMPTLGRPVSEGGVGFDYRLAMAIPDKWIQYMKERKDEDWQRSNCRCEVRGRGIAWICPIVRSAPTPACCNERACRPRQVRSRVPQHSRSGRCQRQGRGPDDRDNSRAMSLSYGLCALAPAPWRAAGAGGGGGMRRNFPDSDLQRRLWRSRGFARRGRLVKSRPGDGIAKGVAFALWKQVSKTPRKLSSKSHGLETLESSERELNAPPRNVAIKSAVDERDGLDQCTPDFEPPSEQQRLGSDFNTLVKRFWRVALPYWSSEDKVEARWRLGTVLALTLATTGISVGFNFLGRDFYNALSSKDQEQFLKQLLYYLGAFVGGIPVFVIRDYSRDTLALRWRAWITQHYMARYFENRTFYNIQSQSLIDNPDQRIVDDLNSFTTTSLVFALAIFNAVIDLISFSGILYGIYPPLFGVLIVYSIGGTALSVALGKGLVGLNFMQEKREADFRYGLVRVRENAESIAFYAGESSEINLLLERFNQSFANYSQLLIASRNLDFFTSAYRYLIQLLPAAVVAPLYFAGKIEFGVINQSFSAFNHILSDFSIIVYQFQSISSFSAVVDRLGEFSEILDQQNTLSRPVTYLGSASEAIESSQTEGGSSLRPRISILDRRETIQPVLNGQNESSRKVPLLMMEHLTLNTPQYTSKLVEDLSVVVNQGEHLLIMGASGSGKTSLLRAIAGLWAAGTGTITRFLRSESEGVDRVSRPDNSEAIPGDTANHAVNGAVTSSSLDISQEIFFLPQRPYMVLGTLRQQILYPIWTERGFTSPLSPKSNGPVTSSAYTDATPVGLKPQPSDEELTDVLERVSLGHLMSSCDGLDANVEWASVLSLGEQQRLAFARLLISKPRLALMDESTSALDEENEMLLYGEIKKSGITYISVGHRTTLKQFHSNILKISKLDGGGCNWTFGPLDRKPDLEVMGSPN